MGSVEGKEMEVEGKGMEVEGKETVAEGKERVGESKGRVEEDAKWKDVDGMQDGGWQGPGVGRGDGRS